MITGKELEKIVMSGAVKKCESEYESSFHIFDWQAIANELNQRQENDIQRLGEEIRDAITPNERIATGSSTTFPNQRTCEMCEFKNRCYQTIKIRCRGSTDIASNHILSCSLYTKEG